MVEGGGETMTNWKFGDCCPKCAQGTPDDGLEILDKLDPNNPYSYLDTYIKCHKCNSTFTLDEDWNVIETSWWKEMNTLLNMFDLMEE